MEKIGRLALVTQYGVENGIGVYSDKLLKEWSPFLSEVKIFAEKHPKMDEFKSESVSFCWSRSEGLDLLAKEILAFAPEIIFIHHEYAFFPHAGAWNKLLASLSEIRTIVFMHSFTTKRSLSKHHIFLKEVVVFSLGVKKEMEKELHTSYKIHVIPYNVSKEDLSKKKNIFGHELKMIQFGFGLSYKGWKRSLQFLKKLQDDKIPCQLTISFSTGPYKEIDYEKKFNELKELAKDLKIDQLINFKYGFQTDSELNSLLNEHEIALFPYENIDWGGGSAAIYKAMSSGLVVVASETNFFENVTEVCLIAKDDDAFFDHLKRLQDKNVRATQLEKQLEFLEGRNFSDQYRKLFLEGCIE